MEPTVYRASAALLLLVLELGAVSLAYDASDLGGQPGLTALLASRATLALQFGVSSMAALTLVLGSRLSPIREALTGVAAPVRRSALAWHAAAALLFMVFCRQLFGAGQTAAPPGPALLLAWLSAGTGVLATLGLLVAPPAFWNQLWRRERGHIAGALLAGVALCAAGQLAQALWLPLSDWTLSGAHGLLALAYPDAYVHPGLILGTRRFAVRISPQCSGYEGIGLILVFVAIYLWLFRAALRFPLALMLLPAGVLGALAANIVRIAALVAVGSTLSPALAQQGFHSQAGWIGFCCVALGLIVAAHRFLLQAGPSEDTRSEPGGAAAGVLASALLVPLLLEVAGGMLAAATRVDGHTLLAPLPGLLAGCALWHFRGIYRGQDWLRAGAPEPVALLLGVAVFLLWVLLTPPAATAAAPAPADLEALPDPLRVVWLAARVMASVLLIPVAEELAFRGYLWRKLAAADFLSIAPGALRPFAVLASSLLFGLLHGAWLAGTLAGIAFALALGRRGRMIDAVAAHATANLLLATAVLGWGRWGLWS